MTAIPIHHEDAMLLSRYVRDGSQNAFSELVRQYERMVLGVAVRRIGDTDLARDVAQRVFAALAQKAALLEGRTSIAGWLYRAASYEAVRLGRSEARRREREQQAVENIPGDGGSDDWSILEEALASIDAKEREALILRYFQDLEYAQIASVLGMTEGAVRKRVSRGLQSLGNQLRRRGISKSAAALITAAAAMQCTLSTQAGLASGALAVAGSAAVPLSLTWNAIMSHTAAKVALCAMAVMTIPLALLWQTNRTLQQETAVPRLATTVQPAKLVSAGVLEDEKALQARLTAIRDARVAAELRLSQLEELQKRLNREVVYSFGTVEEMARRLVHSGDLLESLQANPIPKDGLSREALKDAVSNAKQAMQTLPEFVSTIREIPALEKDPTKAARFYATLIGENTGLDQTQRNRIELIFQPWMEKMQLEGLALPQFPKGDATDWKKQRIAAMREVLSQVQAVVPTPPGQPDPAIFVEAVANDYPVSFWKLTGLEGAK